MTNRVELEGTVASKIAFKILATGTAIANFRIEVPKQKGADWFTVVCWGQMAEQVANQLAEGQLVRVEGRLTSRKYEVEGQPRHVVEVTAEAVTASGGGGGDGAARVRSPWEVG